MWPSTYDRRHSGVKGLAESRGLRGLGCGANVSTRERRRGRCRTGSQEVAIDAHQLTDVVTHHGEGICWDPVAARLRLVDVFAGDLLTLGKGNSNGNGNGNGDVASRWHVGAVVGAWRPRTGGGVVVAVDAGFRLLDATGRVEWASSAVLGPGLRWNDGGCDRDGRFWCGSMDVEARAGRGTLWRLDPDREVAPTLTHLTVPNGLVWSVDGSRAFHVDTPRGTVDVLAHDRGAGTLSGRRPLARVSGGHPDGMALDADGGLWVALWGGAAVHRYAADGRLTAVVEVDAVQVSSCSFGGPGDTRLYVTTSRQGLGETEDPRAGAVFVVDVGVEGAPVATCGS
nr:SMP-30/gluconolactonase/LRE family protein [Nocardioides perillae]